MGVFVVVMGFSTSHRSGTVGVVRIHEHGYWAVVLDVNYGFSNFCNGKGINIIIE